jgi:hypothetical protein
MVAAAVSQNDYGRGLGKRCKPHCEETSTEWCKVDVTSAPNEWQSRRTKRGLREAVLRRQKGVELWFLRNRECTSGERVRTTS